MGRHLFFAVVTLSTIGGVALIAASQALSWVAPAVLLLAAAAAAMLAGDWLNTTPKQINLWGSLPSPATFRGRRRELSELRERFEMLRRRPEANGAIIIAIHGMPGVGKSVLAQEFARGLADLFPDGQLYANLGNAGRIRAEADILGRFIAALRPAESPPNSTLELSARFRSLTASARVLVVLDAARDHEQVARLLPGGDHCAVIVTSRRDLGPALGVHSYPLDVPDTDDALEMLHALAQMPPDEDQKFALEIVDRLGRLPMAIQAVSDSVVENAWSLRPAARRLRQPDLLGPEGQLVLDRIESEYGRLTADEKRAFRLASLMPTPSFVPWSLAALLDLDPIEVEKIVCRLAERRLLEPAGVDELTGLDRYGFHPVFRVFAESQRRAERDRTDAAMRRLDAAYLEAIDRILANTDPTYRLADAASTELRWLPEDFAVPDDIASLPQRWIRAEYANLLRCVRAAYSSGRFAMCWRIAARLGDCVPSHVSRRDVLSAITLGYRAARRSPEQTATARILLARGGFLGRLSGFSGGEDQDGPGGRAAGHREAFNALAAAAHRANRMRSAPMPPGSMPGSSTSDTWPDGGQHPAMLESEAYRRLGEIHLRNGAYRDAARELVRAAGLAEMDDANKEQRALVGLMRLALPGGTPEPQAPAPSSDDEAAFWHGWARAELARRTRRFRDASSTLRRLSDEFEDDASRVAVILLRLAEYRLEQAYLDRECDRERAQTRAVRRAAEAVYRFQQIHDNAGAARARCVFARALLAQGRVARAQEQLGFATEAAGGLEPLLNHELSPLRGMLLQASGELLIAGGLVPEGRAELLAAARLFRLHDDRVAEELILAQLGLPAIPAPAHASGRPTRRTMTWLESDAPALRVGKPFQLFYRIDRPIVGLDAPLGGGQFIDVLVVADAADIRPAVRTVRLDPWAPLDLRFSVVPRSAGALDMRVLVFSSRDGSLLQRARLETQSIGAAG